MARRLALLVASYRYQDAGLRRLEAPQHDAPALADVLRDPGVAGFDVKVLVNEPHHVIGEAIGDFYGDRRRDDLTLLYFTGHGLKDDQGRLYLAMTNTKRERLPWTALPAEQISEAMETCRSRQKVLVLDCCYSGAFPFGRAVKADPAVHTLERFGGKGRAVLTASDATQYSFEGDDLTGEGNRSVFTRYFVEGLRTGQADLDGDGDISLDDLYNYVHDRVVEEVPQQRPKKQENVEGRIIIARNTHWQLPGHLRNAIGSPISTDRLGALDQLRRLHQIGNDLVRMTVLDQVRLLTDNDSRKVSAAATALLGELIPERRCVAFHYDQGCTAVETSRWDKAVEHLTAVTEADPGYRDAAVKLELAQGERSLAGLRSELTGLAQARRWGDALTVWDRIQKIQPDAADPDGSVALAQEQVRREREAERETERAETERQRRVQQLQAELRARGEAQDWSEEQARREAKQRGTAWTQQAHKPQSLPQSAVRVSVSPSNIRLNNIFVGEEVRTTLRVHNALNARAHVNDPSWLRLELSGDSLVVVAKPMVTGAIPGEIVINSDLGEVRVPVRARALDPVRKTPSPDVLIQAAEAGEAAAMRDLAALCEDRGELDKAEGWYRRAAEAGEAAAMRDLAALCEDRGRLGEAEGWYRRAAKAGDPVAAKLIRRDTAGTTVGLIGLVLAGILAVPVPYSGPLLASLLSVLASFLIVFAAVLLNDDAVKRRRDERGHRIGG